MLAARNINTAEYSQPTKKIKSPKSFTRAKLFRNVFHKIADSLTMCARTKEVLGFLMNRSDDYVIRPCFLQKRFGFGNHTWRKITRELRAEGYLMLKIGKVYGGSVWELCIPTVFRAVDSAPTPCSPKNLERSISTPYTINTSTKEQYNRKTTTITEKIMEIPTMTTLDNKAVVILENRMKDEVGLTERDIQQLLSTYTVEQIIEKLGMLKTANADNPIGWFKVALKRNFPSRKPKSLTTASKPSDIEQIKRVYESAIQQADVRIDGYIANMTPEELEEKIRVEEYWKEKLGSRKRDSHSA